MHLLHHFRLKISKSNPYANGFSALSRVIPIIALITLFGYLPEQHQQWGKFALGLQCLGFAAIGLFIVSIYESRAKRFEDGSLRSIFLEVSFQTIVTISHVFIAINRMISLFKIRYPGTT